MISPARIAALDALVSIEGGHGNLSSALAGVRRTTFDIRDQALAHDIVIGTERWRGRLDHVIAGVASRTLDRMDPQIRAILRLSTYQLLFLDRVPSRAVVDDAVALTRTSGKASGAGFVNAVLRAIAGSGPPRLPERPAQGIADGTSIQYLTVTLSHPQWLAERWLARLGFAAAEAWEIFNNSTPLLALAVNTLKTDRDRIMRALADHGITTEESRRSPIGLTVTSGNPLRSPLADRGLFFVQAEASQLVGMFAAVGPGERVLDACAAPGGKAVNMAGTMKGRGVLVAADFRERRLPLLKRTLDLSGATNVQLVRLDLARPLPFRDSFDCVFVDAPCSGLGTLQRDPDIRWRRTPQDLSRFAASQLVQLTSAAEGVKPGGRLIYATCSSEPEENEEVVGQFLAAQPAFRLCDPRSTGRAPDLPDDVLDGRGCLRTEPHRHQMEAFFAAMLVRAA